MVARLPATARREQILEVALQVFATAGFHGASMNAVAEGIGVTKPVLYQHFDSKRELYQALIDHVGERLTDHIAKAATEATDGKSQTELCFRAYFHWVAEDHDGFRFLFGAGSRRDAEFNLAVQQITARAADAIAPLIDVEVDERHRMTIAHALVGLAEGASRMLVEQGDEFDPDEVATIVADLAWAGLRAVHPTD